MTIIKEIYDLDDHESQVLYSAGNAEVRQFSRYRWLNIDGYLIQSVMDLDQPGKLMNPVNIYMLAALYFINNPLRVLNLGFGGGVFERYFNEYYANITLHSVESNETVIQLAREYFNIESAHPVYLQSAEKFVADNDQTYNLILCDIFSQEDHPPCLYGKSFYSDCQGCLSDNGIMVLNLVPESEEDLLEILLQLRKAFRHGCLLEIPEHQNIIVYASKQDFLTMRRQQVAGLNQIEEFEVDDFISMLKHLPLINGDHII